MSKIIHQQQNKINDLKIQNQKLETELKKYKDAFDLMSIVLCTGARDDLKRQLGKFTLRKEVKQFFLEQAEKERK